MPEKETEDYENAPLHTSTLTHTFRTDGAPEGVLQTEGSEGPLDRKQRGMKSTNMQEVQLHYKESFKSVKQEEKLEKCFSVPCWWT